MECYTSHSVPFPTACHVFECHSTSQYVLTTIGQAFELRYKIYLTGPKATPLHVQDRSVTQDVGWGPWCSQTQDVGWGPWCSQTQDVGWGPWCSQTQDVGWDLWCSQTQDMGWGPSETVSKVGPLLVPAAWMVMPGAPLTYMRTGEQAGVTHPFPSYHQSPLQEELGSTLTYRNSPTLSLPCPHPL